jgi:cell wall-associated NlpC family hydrolase
MKTGSLSIAILGLLVFTSCSSVRKFSSRDSASSTTTLRKANNNSKREFLNGIEVTPGGMIASNTAKQKVSVPVTRKPETGNVQLTHTRPDTKMMSQGIEDASMLQLKYAIATDATVEKLTNIPLLQVIDKWWGTRYCMGGSTDDCIDCSAFTQILMRDVYQLPLPRTSQEQYNACEKIDLEDLKEGDLVFFNTDGKDVSHVGVYLLNNKFVHAATSGGVMISDLNDKYWQPKFLGAGRISSQATAGLVKGSN